MKSVTLIFSSLVSPEPQRPKSLILENLPGLIGGPGTCSSSVSPSTDTRRSSDGGNASSASPSTNPNNVVIVPDVEEIRVSPIISKRGFLNILEQRTKVWKKRFVVVRRPYVFLFRDERDVCERGLINLAQAKTELFSAAEQQALAKNTFSVVTRTRGYLLQTGDERELQDWLYAINPLLAGQIRSRTARNRPKTTPTASTSSDQSRK